MPWNRSSAKITEECQPCFPYTTPPIISLHKFQLQRNVANPNPPTGCRDASVQDHPIDQPQLSPDTPQLRPNHQGATHVCNGNL